MLVSLKFWANQTISMTWHIDLLLGVHEILKFFNYININGGETMSCSCQKKTSHIIDMSKISDFVSLRQDRFAESSAVLEASVDVTIKAVKATCNDNTVLHTVLDICHFYVTERGLFHPCSLYLI